MARFRTYNGDAGAAAHADCVDVFEVIAAAGGPRPDQYAQLLVAAEHIHAAEFETAHGLSRRVTDSRSLARVFERHPTVFRSTASMQGFIALQPHGYPGDFEVIEKIYRKSICALEPVRQWDEFFHSCPEAHAVRHRSEMALAIIEQQRPQTVASIACGPALDLVPAIGDHDDIRYVLLDNDPNALRRARVNTARANAGVSLECANVLRWKPHRKFEFIWCSGLFDYLSDRVAIVLIRRLLLAMAPGASLAIGNFAPGHIGRAYMELVGEWLLYHRTPYDLVRIAAAAGVDASRMRVESDPAGVNLFLIVEP